MDRRTLGAICTSACALALLFSAPAAAQEGAKQQVTEDLSQMFDEIVSDFQEFPEFDEVMGAAMEPLMATSEVQENWKSLGVNIQAELERLPGGTSENVLFEDNPDGVGVSGYGVPLAETGFSNFAYSLSRAPMEVNEFSIVQLEPGIWLEMKHESSRLGNAVCYNSDLDVTLHTQVPFEEIGEETFFALLGIHMMMQKFAELEVCAIYERQEDGLYRSRAFMPDGRELTQLNALSVPIEVRKKPEIPQLLGIGG